MSTDAALDDGVPIERVTHSPAIVYRYSRFFAAKGWMCVLCCKFFRQHTALEAHFDKAHLRYAATDSETF